MEHLKKEIMEQIAILSEHRQGGSDLCFQFVRNHALSIVQLSEEAIGTCSFKCPRHDRTGRDVVA
jgi:hypothetical protein